MRHYISGLVSVIVPVYCVARYLPQCIDSILKQDYKELEVILIDDGSPDLSGQICDQYAVQDPRIVVIHKINGGAASARNAGLKIAQGEYIYFVDADDYIETGCIRKMINMFDHFQADVVECAFRCLYKNEVENIVKHEDMRSYSAEEYLKRFLTDWTCGLIWNKLYRHSVIDGVFFEEGHQIDDEFFTYQVIMNASKLLVISDVLYDYRQRQSSVMNDKAKTLLRLYDRLLFLKLRMNSIIDRFPQLKQDFERGYLDSLLFLASDPSSTPEFIRSIKKDICRYFQRKDHEKVDLKQLYNILNFLLSPSWLMAHHNQKLSFQQVDQQRQYYE